MDIKKALNGGKLTLEFTGRLDTTTAPQFENAIKSLDGVNELVCDFKSLEYISSAGLRVLLAAQKVMNSKGRMIIKNVCPEIMEVFEITGFADILTIEE